VINGVQKWDTIARPSHSIHVIKCMIGKRLSDLITILEKLPIINDISSQTFPEYDEGKHISKIPLLIFASFSTTYYQNLS
jgi:hypothetical protein